MCKKSLLILLYSLCLLFYSVSFAELSDKEKRAFIEELARPFPERRVFYRWQSEISRRTLMREKVLTEKRFKYFMNIRDDVWAGPGLYAAEDLHSSTYAGDTIMQIEVGTEMKYIDLTDSNTLRKLKKKGITRKDVYKLNPKIAVRTKFQSIEWVFKARKGLTFQAFSSKEIPWNELNGPALAKLYFREAIKDDVKNRIKAKQLSIHSTREVKHILSVARDYMKPEEIKQIVHKAIPLIKNTADGIYILSVARDYMKPEEVKQIMHKTISLIKSTKEGRDFLFLARDYLEPEEIKQIMHKTISLIKSTKEGRDFLFLVRDYMKPEEIKQIVHKTIPLIKNAKEGGDVLLSMRDYMKPEEIKQIVHKTIPLIKNTADGIYILFVARDYMKPEEIKQIMHKTISLIKSTKEGRDFLKPEEKKQIVKRVFELNGRKELKGLKHYLTDEEYLQVLKGYLTDEEYKKALAASIKGAKLKCLKKQLAGFFLNK